VASDRIDARPINEGDLATVPCWESRERNNSGQFGGEPHRRKLCANLSKLTVPHFPDFPLLTAEKSSIMTVPSTRTLAFRKPHDPSYC
jgi:hypothetical protein